jgi:hypothetical protein
MGFRDANQHWTHETEKINYSLRVFPFQLLEPCFLIGVAPNIQYKGTAFVVDFSVIMYTEGRAP